jgi:hypothetical protein
MSAAVIEEWREAPGFPSYEVSNMGRVRRSAPGSQTHVGKVLRANPTNKGYLRLTLFAQGRARHVSVHRLVCEAFHGPPPTGGHETAHWDGNRTNNCATNLRWATRKENAADRVRHGTNRRVGRHNRAKLTNEQVALIRDAPESQWAIARQFGVHRATVCDIKKRRTWAHVQ